MLRARNSGSSVNMLYLRVCSRRGQRRWMLQAITLFTLLYITAFIMLVRSSETYVEDAAVPADLITTADLTVSRQLAGSATDDALYRSLHAALTAVTPRSGCRWSARLGGICTCRVTRWSAPGGDTTWAGVSDGAKHVCLDTLLAAGPNCTVLSAGINHDFSFETAVAELGCDVTAFDPTMGVPAHRVAPRVQFFDVGIAASDGVVRDGLGGELEVRSLASLLRTAGVGRGPIDYVKLDVESAEWGVLEAELAAGGGVLRRVRQLAVELHLRQWQPQLEAAPRAAAAPLTPPLARRFLRVLVALQGAGFRLANSACDEAACLVRTAEFCLSAVCETLWVNTHGTAGVM